MELTPEQKLIPTIINKTREDEVVKKELVADPVAAIKKLTDEKLNLPDGEKLVIRDQTNEEVITYQPKQI